MRNKAEKTTLPNWITKRFCVGLPPALLGGQITVISSQVPRIPCPHNCWCSLFTFTRVAADASGAFALFARTSSGTLRVVYVSWWRLSLFTRVVGQLKTSQCIHMSRGHRPHWPSLKPNSTAARLLVKLRGGLGGLFCTSVSIRKIIKHGDVPTSRALSTKWRNPKWVGSWGTSVDSLLFYAVPPPIPLH